MRQRAYRDEVHAGVGDVAQYLAERLGTDPAYGSGPLAIDSPLSIELYRVSMLAPTKSSGISFNGILGERQDEILDLMVRQQKAVLIDPVERQTELRN